MWFLWIFPSSLTHLLEFSRFWMICVSLIWFLISCNWITDFGLLVFDYCDFTGSALGLVLVVWQKMVFCLFPFFDLQVPHGTGVVHCKFFLDHLYNFQGTNRLDPSTDCTIGLGSAQPFKCGLTGREGATSACWSLPPAGLRFILCL